MKLVNHLLDSHILTVVVLAVVVVGAVKSIAGDLSYDDYVRTISVLVGATAIGRGLAAYKK